MTKGKWLTAGLLLTLGSIGVFFLVFASGVATVELERISIDPSRTDQRFGILAEPLVALAEPSASETRDLEWAISRYRKSRDFARATAIDEFLKQYPQSVWRGSLLTNRGLANLHEGYFSRAIASFEKAWHAGAKAKTPAQRAIRDRALGELLTLETRLGHVQKVKALLAAIGTRALAGSASEDLASAKFGLRDLKHNPGSSNRCGAAALEAVAKVRKMSASDLQRIEDAEAGAIGMTLAQLTQLAAKAHLPSHAVYRSGGEPIPVPSVVHWKENHYGAIVGERNGLYRLRDPVFDQDHWVTRAALESESSGYFLVPDNPAQYSWRTVAAKEAARVVGAGYTTQDEKGATATDDAKSCPTEPKSGKPHSNQNSCACSSAGKVPSFTGMANYDVHLMLVSLNIKDNPVGYSPPKGPAVPITLSYIQREAYEPANFSYFNLGHKWTINWRSFVQDDPNHPGQSVSIGLPGGGTRFYDGYNTSTGIFTPEERSGAELVMISAAPAVYERRMSDGTVYVYGASDDSVTFPRRVFLTQKIDPTGNAVTLAYDGLMRLTTIADALGQQTTFDYTNSINPLLVTAVTDPFGRHATIEYDASGRLISITDEIGLRSQFSYDSGTFITAMTTPYGTTSFSYGENGRQRWLNITDPKGQTERYEFRHDAPGIPFSLSVVPSSVGIYNANINRRNTFYWDKTAWARAPGDYTKARIYHWLHKAGDVSTTAGVLESIKQPLESRVWYNYPGQVHPGGARYAFTGTLDKPSVIARVLDDGSTQLTRISYNAQGNVTKRIDPVGRELDYTYAANGIDLLKVMRKTATGYATLALYTYNDRHEPLTYIDAAGQATTYTYNSAGQLATTTDPLGNTITNTYDSSGYLMSVTNANGKVAHSYTYDTYGRVAAVTDSEGYSLAYSYDDLGRLTAIKYPDGTQRTITWDRLDPVAYTDREGRTTSYAYDSIRELVSKTSPMGHITSYEYEPSGELKSLADPKGHTTHWIHDIQGRVTEKQYADGSTENIVYAGRGGELISVTDTLGQTKSYSYTHDDRLAGIQYLNAVNSTPSVSYLYDPYYPRLTGMTDGIGTTFYQYYPAGEIGAGHLATEQGPQTHDIITYGYDEGMRLVRRTVDGADESYSYDALDRETGIMNPLGIFTLSYLGETSQITERDIAGVPYRVRYDYETNINDRRLKAIFNETTIHGRSRPVIDYLFTTSPERLILSRTENDGTQGKSRHQMLNRDHQHGWGQSPNWVVPGWLFGEEGDSDEDASKGITTQYTYDDDLRLVGASGATTESYSYDSANNLTSVLLGEATISIAVNSVNAIQNAGGNTYVYDANGNVLDDGTRTFAWDAENRLTQVTSKTTGHVSAFVYDGRSHRILNKETEPGGDPVETRYLWCGEVICEQRDSGGNVTGRYYRQGELHDGQNFYYAQDQVESVVAFLDNTGRVVKRTAYSSFGTTNVNTGTSSEYRFARLFSHDQSGLYLATYRAYDSRVGRWLSRDPIAELGGINLYEYTSGNPLRFIDPSGLLCVYSQNTGLLTCTDDATGQQYLQCKGYAGNGPGLNNSNTQDVSNVGPLPQGDYTVGGPIKSDNMGPITRPLIPNSNNDMFGRSGFYIHGDNAAQNNSASRGCPIFPRNCRESIRAGETFRVVP